MRLVGTIQFCTCTRPGISSLRPYDSVLLRTRYRLSILYLKRRIYPMNIALLRNAKSRQRTLAGRLTPAHQYSIQWGCGMRWNRRKNTRLSARWQQGKQSLYRPYFPRVSLVKGARHNGVQEARKFAFSLSTRPECWVRVSQEESGIRPVPVGRRPGRRTVDNENPLNNPTDGK